MRFLWVLAEKGTATLLSSLFVCWKTRPLLYWRVQSFMAQCAGKNTSFHLPHTHTPFGEEESCVFPLVSAEKETATLFSSVFNTERPSRVSQKNYSKRLSFCYNGDSSFPLMFGENKIVSPGFTQAVRAGNRRSFFLAGCHIFSLRVCRN
jgi:hypothetical protein